MKRNLTSRLWKKSCVWQTSDMSDLIRNPLCRFLDSRNQLAIVSGLALWFTCTHGVYKPKSDTGRTRKRCLTGFLDLVWHVRRMSDKKYHFFSPKSRLLKNWIVTFWFFLAVKSPGTDADAKKDRMWNYRLVLKRQTSEHSLKSSKIWHPAVPNSWYNIGGR